MSDGAADAAAHVSGDVLDTLALYTWSDDRAVRQFRAVATRRLE